MMHFPKIDLNPSMVSVAKPSRLRLTPSTERAKANALREWHEFLDTELAWPNCEPSGITPTMLATRPFFKGVTASGDATKDRPQTFCERALYPKKPTRPENLPQHVLVIRSDPPSVDTDDVEEFLVNDALFVEFFNAFLSLPAFPEPVCFNVDTGGFEVVSDGRKKLAKQIKEAVRSQNFTPKIYRLARQHAFSDMPLIPIEDTEGGPEGVKIDTTYNVTVLNKDQGIYWIKAERLPIFLESDFYVQYRLAKVISQARLFNDDKEFVVMKIDFTPRQKKVKKSVEVPPPNVEDNIVKQMFVSFGDVKGAAKEAWFTQAKEGISTNPMFTTLSPKMSTNVAKPQPSSADLEQKRPKSSVFHSPYFGVYAPGLVGPGEQEPPIHDDDILNDRMFHRVEDRPFTPRPSDKIHVSTNNARKHVRAGDDEQSERMVKPGPVVFVLPKQDNSSVDSDFGSEDMKVNDDELEKRMNMQPIIDSIYNDDSWDVASSIGLKNINEFGSVIVGAVMKKTLADLLTVSGEDILQDPAVSGIYPSEELTCITVDDLDKCYVADDSTDSDENKKMSKEEGESEESKKMSKKERKKAKYEEEKAKDGKKAQKKEEPAAIELTPKNPRFAFLNREIKKSAEEESDADSLLDSDEDFEEEDIHFRRNKDKWYNLTSLKGIMNFKKFLSGTPGDKYWELWMDIDKGRLISDEEEGNNYNIYMRGKYHKQGSPFELSKEDKIKLKLESPSSWCKEHLFEIQGKVMEPLVLYWAPRYLLKHLLQTDPDKYYMYSAMKSCQPPKESDPYPMTKSMIPLRPKSCCPRTRQGPGVEEMNSFRNNLNCLKANEAEFVTTPKVGNRRIYGKDTMVRLAKTPTAKYLDLEPPPESEQDYKSLYQGLSRPPTASSRRSSIVKDDSNTHVVKSREESVHSALSDESGRRKTKVRRAKESTTDRFDNGFVGKLPGIGSKTRLIASAGPAKCRDIDSKARCKSAQPTPLVTQKSKSIDIRTDSGDRLKIPCPARGALGAELGLSCAEQTASGELLGPVKKPRDLLSPKLRILDTKQQRSRQTSAVRRSESKMSEKVTFYRQDSLDSSKVCDSRPTSGSRNGMENIHEADMTDCDFMGSERMEMLLKALHHDNEAGRAFRKFMEKDEENHVALNCFAFWENVQEYRKLFYKDKLDLFLINKQAKVIFAQFIVSGSPKFIEISESIELQVMEKLKPAYEDLYDEAEEHALKVLFGEFLEFLCQDVKTYCKVERSEISRRLETKNTYILNLQKKGIIKEGPLTPDDPMDGYVDPVYDESILEKIPEEFRDWTFDKLVHNRLELEHFRQYLSDNYSEIDLKCWMDMEAWRRTPPTDARKRDNKAKDIKKLYLNKKYFFGPSSPAGKEGQDKVMEAAGGWGKFLEDKPHHDAILEAQKYVAERLEKKHLPMFLASKEFQERQAPKITSDDIADDVVVQKKRRNQAVLKVGELREEFHEKFYKQNNLKIIPIDSTFTDAKLLPTIKERLLESKWVSSTKEIYIFKQALKNPVTCRQFQKYISVKGDNLENDLLFWLEVQRYKQMHHLHTEDSMLLQKINAIIQCFIDSSIPPSLQIDIPQDMADRILDHKHEKGPYLFRESQLATFRILLTHWIPFCEFRNNMGSDEKVMKTLERHRLAMQHREMRYQEELEKEKQRRLLDPPTTITTKPGKQDSASSMGTHKQKSASSMGESASSMGESTSSTGEKSMMEDGDLLPEELREDDDDKAKISFSYASYLSQERAAEGYDDDGTQTIRGIPQFPDQDYRVRPGYKDDPSVPIRAKEYNEDDVLVYSKYLKFN